MSILYSVIPIDESITNQELIDWLKHWDVSLPESFEFGRYPSGGEMRQIVQALEAQGIRLSHPLFNAILNRVDLSDGITFTEFSFWQTSEAVVRHIGFRGGDYRFIQRVTQQLANLCGTYLLTMDGEEPILVFPAQSE